MDGELLSVPVEVLGQWVGIKVDVQIVIVYLWDNEQ